MLNFHIVDADKGQKIAEELSRASIKYIDFTIEGHDIRGFVDTSYHPFGLGGEVYLNITDVEQLFFKISRK